MTTWNRAIASGIGDVAVNPGDATVWVAGKDNGTIWFSKKPNNDYAGKQFTQISASGFRRLSVWSPSDFPAGELWAVGANGTVWHCRYDTDKNAFNSEWVKTPANGVVDIAVASNGLVWLASQDGSIFFSDDRCATLHKTQASGMNRVSVGPDGTLWAVGSNGTLWSCNLQTTPSYQEKWVKTAASGMGDVGVHPFLGTVWLAGKNGTIWYSTDRGKNFTWVEDASGFESVAAGSLNSGVDVWGVGGNETLWYKTPELTDTIKKTKYFNIRYDKSLGQAGIDASNGLAQVVDGVYEQQAALFGLSTPPASITLTVWAMTGGGLSEGMSGIDIYAAASAAGEPSYDLGQARYVFAQESAEVCMRAQKGGWYPSDSKGEALSRFLGELAFPGSAVKYGYATGQSWVNQVDRGDWVTHNENNDTTDFATGCAILFLNYMTSQLHLDLRKIIADKSAFLSQVYTNLTGNSNAYGPFRDIMERHFPAKTSFQSFPPPGYPYALSDNPFPLS
jgi:hypothetical protein